MVKKEEIIVAILHIRQCGDLDHLSHSNAERVMDGLMHDKLAQVCNCGKGWELTDKGEEYIDKLFDVIKED